MLGLVYGEYPGRSDGFVPGALSFECGFTPHGGTCPLPILTLQFSLNCGFCFTVSGEVYDAAANGDLKPVRIHDGTLMIMFETSMMLTVTDYAMNTDKRHGTSPPL